MDFTYFAAYNSLTRPQMWIPRRSSETRRPLGFVRLDRSPLFQSLREVRHGTLKVETFVQYKTKN